MYHYTKIHPLHQLILGIKYISMKYYKIIQKLQNLWALDFNTVSDEERYEYLLYSHNRFHINGPITELDWPIINNSS